MKKVVSIIFVLFLVVGFTNAQTGKMKLGIGPYVGLPMGTFGDVVNLGFGGVAQGEYEFTPQVVGTVTAGYITFPGKDVSLGFGSSYTYKFNMIPIWVGAKYFFSPNFYGVANVGLNFVTVSLPSFSYGGYTVGGGTASESDFGFQVGAGYDMGNLDFSVRYGSFGASNSSALSLMALYKFPLN